MLPQNKEDYGCILADKICIKQQEMKKLTWKSVQLREASNTQHNIPNQSWTFAIYEV